MKVIVSEFPWGGGIRVYVTGDDIDNSYPARRYYGLGRISGLRWADFDGDGSLLDHNFPRSADGPDLVALIEDLQEAGTKKIAERRLRAGPSYGSSGLRKY